MDVTCTPEPAEEILHPIEMDRRELAENAVLWIASMDGYVASFLFTRKGQYFKNWFLELRPDDVVLFRMRTTENYRGRGLAPSLMRHAMHNCVAPPARAFIDCRTYNKPSIRAIQKAGFQCVAKKRTIRRDWALHGRGS